MHAKFQKYTIKIKTFFIITSSPIFFTNRNLFCEYKAKVTVTILPNLTIICPVVCALIDKLSVMFLGGQILSFEEFFFTGNLCCKPNFSAFQRNFISPPPKKKPKIDKIVFHFYPVHPLLKGVKLTKVLF